MKTKQLLPKQLSEDERLELLADFMLDRILEYLDSKNRACILPEKESN